MYSKQSDMPLGECKNEKSRLVQLYENFARYENVSPQWANVLTGKGIPATHWSNRMIWILELFFSLQMGKNPVLFNYVSMIFIPELVTQGICVTANFLYSYHRFFTET